jgi:hypothetical protein
MFQDIKSQVARRELGEHYTSEVNILKVISPLFLVELNERLRHEWDSAAALRRLQEELASYNWLDPACGCGNFLVVTYKRIRDIELRLLLRLTELEKVSGRALFGELRSAIRLSQFHGIEYLEWSSQIASVAMFLAEHQANLEMERLLGAAPDLLPLSDAPSIFHGNALRVDWHSVCPINEQTFILGNPPFGGFHLQNEEQKEDAEIVWQGAKGFGVMDYVTNWFVIAGRLAAETSCHVAFVATNSISQGEQPPILWHELSPLGLEIDFAHQTFRWSNDSSGQAAVHTIIVGFSKGVKRGRRPLWTYETVSSEPVLTMASNINAYIADGPNVLITSRRKPLVNGVPQLAYGNKPTDNGLLSKITATEAASIARHDPIAAKYLHPLIGAEELLNGGDRWCLWLIDVRPEEIRASPELSRRVKSVAAFRLESKKEVTRRDATRPWEFQEIRQPTGRFIAVPRHSSEGRHYLPVAYFTPDVIINDAVSIVDDGSLVIFGILSSRLFRIWANAVSGRLKNDLRLSSEITYNNFPWPECTAEQQERIERAGQRVLEVRSQCMDGESTTLADLYDPLVMPTRLRDAHSELDRAVMAAIGLRISTSDTTILAKLFESYQILTGGMLPESPLPTISKRKRVA